MDRLFLWKIMVIVFGCALITFADGGGYINAASVGQQLSNLQIRDANDNPATIPDFGTHVIGLFYSDSGASDLGDPLADTIKARNYSKNVYRGLGVANMKDSAEPNFIIRSIIRGKIEKYKSTILTDVDLTIPRAWDLGDCKNKSVFVLIGKDRKIKYLKFVDKDNLWSNAEINSVIKMIDDLLKKK
jgi:Bacterial protein of unknown function (YtfJ_HI0045)